MNLNQGIELYVEEKRAAGMLFGTGNQSLTSFCRQVGDVSLNRIRPQQIVTFLNGPRTSDITWVDKYNLLRNFFLFWAARDLMRPLRMPPPRRPAPQNSTPYIYSQTEIRLLLSSTRVAQDPAASRIDARTLRTFLLFLYGTGVLIGDGRRLLREDVNLKRGFVTIWNSRLQPARTIPFGPDLHKILLSYCNTHHRKHPNSQHFFVRKDGKGLDEPYLNRTFQKLRRIAGVSRHDGMAQPPRMHDLRYTFAVHRLTSWHKHGADLNRMIPALSGALFSVDS